MSKALGIKNAQRVITTPSEKQRIHTGITFFFGSFFLGIKASFSFCSAFNLAFSAFFFSFSAFFLSFSLEGEPSSSKSPSDDRASFPFFLFFFFLSFFFFFESPAFSNSAKIVSFSEAPSIAISTADSSNLTDVSASSSSSSDATSTSRSLAKNPFPFSFISPDSSISASSFDFLRLFFFFFLFLLLSASSSRISSIPSNNSSSESIPLVKSISSFRLSSTGILFSSLIRISPISDISSSSLSDNISSSST